MKSGTYRIKENPAVPEGEVWLTLDGKVVGRIVGIEHDDLVARVALAVGLTAAVVGLALFLATATT